MVGILNGVWGYHNYVSDADFKGCKFYYLAIKKNRKTGEQEFFNRSDYFLNSTAFNSCLDRWNKFGERSGGDHQWIYKESDNI